MASKKRTAKASSGSSSSKAAAKKTAPAKKAPAKTTLAKKAPAKKAPAKKAPAKLRVLFASSEAAPFCKTGGLGDVAGSLPYALAEAGVDVAVVLPKYASIPSEFRDKMESLAEFRVPLSWRNVYCGIEHLEHRGIDFYFIDNEDYFKRDGVYGYFDDGERFAFFAKAILEAMEHVEGMRCDVLHCNDWQTALCPVFLREFYRGDAVFDNIKCVFTIHNVQFQGQYSEFVLGDILGLSGIYAAESQLVVRSYDGAAVNYMKGAVCYSDALTTVSPTYAEELKTPYYGEHLEGEFQRRSDIVSGVLNGIDLDEWDPQTDPYIAATFSAADLSGKAACKVALQEELGLEADPARPLVVNVGRLTKQKGLDLIQYSLEAILSRGVQVAILGTGDAAFEDSLRYFDWKYPGQMSARITFDNALAHRMYAGADLFLMPSQFEPCGLSQMISMRYATLPVVRETGGLADSVIAYNRYTGTGNGFSFANFNADEMAGCLLDACEVFWTDEKAWKALQLQAMAADFGWDRAAQDYLAIYGRLHPELACGKGA